MLRTDERFKNEAKSGDAVRKATHELIDIIHTRRKEYELTQVEVAEKGCIGTSTISHIEHDESITLDSFLRYAYGCGIDLEKLCEEVKKLAR